MDDLSLEERMRNIKRDLNAKYRDQEREDEYDDDRGRDERGRGGDSKRRLDSGQGRKRTFANAASHVLQEDNYNRRRNDRDYGSE